MQRQSGPNTWTYDQAHGYGDNGSALRLHTHNSEVLAVEIETLTAEVSIVLDRSAVFDLYSALALYLAGPDSTT